MSTPVEIVIRAVDRFSPAFDALEDALRRADGAGAGAGDALAGVGASLERLGATSAEADAALAAFAGAAGTRLGALDAERMASMERLAAQHRDVTEALAGDLLALDEQTSAAREAQLQASLGRVRQAWEENARAIVAIQSESIVQREAREAAYSERHLEFTRQRLQLLRSLLEGHGGTLARVAKALAVSEALIAAYLAGNKALATVPFPFNLAVAAAVTAQGLATVERIRQVNVAHGGLERVPEDGTFLLQRGERVLSAGQNRELSRFMERGGGSGGVSGGGAGGGTLAVQQLTVNVLPNATNADALLRMDRAELQRLVSERLIPVFDALARQGIKPAFVEANL